LNNSEASNQNKEEEEKKERRDAHEDIKNSEDPEVFIGVVIK
jgi:hypothetical protein